jgi:uncharacterized membrane protein YkvA (DUF1232 family)
MISMLSPGRVVAVGEEPSPLYAPYGRPIMPGMRVTETLRAWARRVKRDGVTLWFALGHPATPWPVKAIAAFVVAYALSPIDLIPDFVPVLGYVDDVLLLPGLIWACFAWFVWRGRAG